MQASFLRVLRKFIYFILSLLIVCGRSFAISHRTLFKKIYMVRFIRIFMIVLIPFIAKGQTDFLDQIKGI